MTLSRDPEVVKEKGGRNRGLLADYLAQDKSAQGYPQAPAPPLGTSKRAGFRLTVGCSRNETDAFSTGCPEARTVAGRAKERPSWTGRRNLLVAERESTDKRRLGTFSFSQPISRGNRASRRPGQDFGGRFVRRSIASSAYHAPPGSRMTVVSRPVVTRTRKSTLSALEAHHRPEHLEALQARCADLREGARARARVALDDDGPPERPVVRPANPGLGDERALEDGEGTRAWCKPRPGAQHDHHGVLLGERAQDEAPAPAADDDVPWLGEELDLAESRTARCESAPLRP